MPIFVVNILNLMMNRTYFKTLTYALLVFVFCSFSTSCQKAVVEEEAGTEEATDGEVAVQLNVMSMEQFDFAKASPRSRATEIKSLCTRINIALYQNGEQVKKVNQTDSEDGFGSLTLKLKKGRYAMLVLAHSGAGNPTMTHPEKVTFTDNKVTDTFFLYDSLIVSTDASVDITLHRAVAMFRLKMTDSMPSNVTTMHFYYTGGSSTFDATTGYGCVASKQNQQFSVGEEQWGTAQTYEVYTFPHADGRTLKMQIKALNDNEVVKSRVFTDVPVTKNQITQYSGQFFSDSETTDPETPESKTDTSTVTIPIVTNDEWTTESYNF